MWGEHPITLVKAVTVRARETGVLFNCTAPAMMSQAYHDLMGPILEVREFSFCAHSARPTNLSINENGSDDVCDGGVGKNVPTRNWTKTTNSSYIYHIKQSSDDSEFWSLPTSNGFE